MIVEPGCAICVGHRVPRSRAGAGRGVIAGVVHNQWIVRYTDRIDSAELTALVKKFPVRRQRRTPALRRYAEGAGVKFVLIGEIRLGFHVGRVVDGCVRRIIGQSHVLGVPV